MVWEVAAGTVVTAVVARVAVAAVEVVGWGWDAVEVGGMAVAVLEGVALAAAVMVVAV